MGTLSSEINVDHRLHMGITVWSQLHIIWWCTL